MMVVYDLGVPEGIKALSEVWSSWDVNSRLGGRYEFRRSYGSQWGCSWSGDGWSFPWRTHLSGGRNTVERLANALLLQKVNSKGNILLNNSGPVN